MKTDRELLELAAKAASVVGHFANNGEDSPIFFDNPKTPGVWGVWNPLTDDGDALRLSVKLKLCFGPNFAGDTAVCFGFDGSTLTEIYGNDPCAATRRAIVRAAAEIGETK